MEPTGKWGLTLTAGMSGMGYIGTRVLPPVLLKEGAGHVANLPVANPNDYDALIILGGWSGDILYADDIAIDFIKKVVDRKIPIAAIGEGIPPLIKLGVVNGRKATGNVFVSYMLRQVADFLNEPVVVDGNLITARDTVDVPALLRALCKVFDPTFVDVHKDILKGKRIMVMIADDFEDVEMCVPVLEFIYRGQKSLSACLSLMLEHVPA